jgi:hypothetical protein
MITEDEAAEFSSVEPKCYNDDVDIWLTAVDVRIGHSSSRPDEEGAALGR